MIEQLKQYLGLGSLLQAMSDAHGGYEVVELWEQGEYHHDLLLRVDGTASGLPGRYLVVAINCNGGVKELLSFDEPPTRAGLWQLRGVAGEPVAMPRLLASARTLHWVEPSLLLGGEAPAQAGAQYCEPRLAGLWREKIGA